MEENTENNFNAQANLQSPATEASAVSGRPESAHGVVRFPVGNNLALAIITTFFCCMPLGIISIIYACKTDAAASRGEFAKALKYSGLSEKWSIAAVIIGFVYFALMLIFNLAGTAITAFLK